MLTPGILYQMKTASSEDILKHLIECDTNFIPPLSQKVALEEYSQKLFEMSITFEAWINKALIGLIAGYFNQDTNICFISNVSVLLGYQGKGIAHQLMINCIEYSRNKNNSRIILEVNNANVVAIAFYKKIGFIDSGNRGDSIIKELNL
jgi:ribosomal protein S18 acetylase RimI-like enzyme